MPKDAAAIVLSQLTKAVEANSGGLTIGLVVSLLATLWAAAGGLSALMTGLNVIYGVHEGRNFLKLRALALGLTIGAMVAVAVALGLVAAFPVVLSRIGLGPIAALIAQTGRWVVLALVITIGLSVVYRWGPDRRDARWRPVSVGTIVALVVWVLASVGFSLYVSNFGRYNKTYGSLAAIIVLMMWLYLSSFAVLLGAEVDSVRIARKAAAEQPDTLARAGVTRPAALTGASDTVPEPPVPVRHTDASDTSAPAV
jgi:membrane protein